MTTLAPKKEVKNSNILLSVTCIVDVNQNLNAFRFFKLLSPTFPFKPGMALTSSSTLVGNGSGDRDRDRERTQSWRIHVTAKAKHLNFRFRFAAAATYAPTWTLSFFRLSLLLHLPQFVFKISSDPKQGRASLITTKVMKFFHKFRPRLLNKNQPNIAAAKSKTKTESNLSYPKVS